MDRCRPLGWTAVFAIGVAAVASAQEQSALGTRPLLSPAMMAQVEGEDDAGPILSPYLRGAEITGYVSTSYTYNFNNSDDATPAGFENPPPRVFDNRHNELMLNAVVIDILRPTGDDAIVGYQITPLIGDDASVINVAATAVQPGDVFAADDFTLTNANVKVLLPFLRDTEVTIGRFETTIGAETIHSPFNANFSRSILFGFAIPFTHTGALLQTPIWQDDEAGASIVTKLGWVNGWDVIQDANDSGTLLASLVVQPVEFFSLAVNSAWGPEQPEATAASANADYRSLIDIVATLGAPQGLTDQGLGFLEHFSLSLNLDWGGEEGVAGVGSTGGEGYAQWWGFAGILRVDFPLPIFDDGDTNNWFIALRGEYFDDVDGSRLFGAGTDGDVYEITGTLGFRPVEMLLIRGEVRFDQADHRIFDSDSGAPRRSHQTTVALNFAVLF